MKAINLLDPRGFIIAALAVALLGVAGPHNPATQGTVATLVFDVNGITQAHDGRCMGTARAAAPQICTTLNSSAWSLSVGLAGRTPVLTSLSCTQPIDPTTNFTDDDEIWLSPMWVKGNDTATPDITAGNLLIYIVGDGAGTADTGDAYTWTGAERSPFVGGQMLAIRIDVASATTFSTVGISCTATVMQ